MDQRLVDAAARSYAALDALQTEVLRILDAGQPVPADVQDRLRAAQAAHDEAEGDLWRHAEGR